MSNYSTAQEPAPEGEDLAAAPLDSPAPESSVPAPAGVKHAATTEASAAEPASGPATEASAPAEDAKTEDTPPPIPTGFPEPATEGDTVLSGTVVTDTGTPTFPQPMDAAPAGHVNLATVPPMGALIIPPLDGDGEPVTITVYGTTVDDATAERAYAAARTAGFNLREL